ncbi:hypothetical protein PHYPSEUDO_011033 [Phytophthora pseudosyringae]|uniref:Uncharacterized protein n=1 Tax=Phytophthora pseudosyringae TaxID=221518 RepID=A0A8T1VCG1_9STRA|nr:hypothetical protein PHYPSEUDO_011033 [Phytophthora pseudosyringae]
MALTQGYCRRRRSPRWLPLLLDVVLVTLSILLDVRDLWFKLRWVGPHDTFAFSTAETRYLRDAAPLQPTTTFSYADQKIQRASGWSSFLEKCESLTPLPEEGGARGFRHAVGKNCVIGASTSSIRVAELFITSSIRVDSMAWAACELLLKHRKPPICHSPIVIQFRERYNFLDEISVRAIESLTIESTGAISDNIAAPEAYAAVPGGDAEAELIELLEVISKSSPVSAAVCVEGFVVKGSGRYTTSIHGCGSPSFYRSVLVGSDTSMVSQFLRDRSWLTSNTLQVMGMTFLIRENHRSVFTVHESAKDDGKRKYCRDLSVYVVAIVEAAGSLRVSNLFRMDNKNGL